MDATAIPSLDPLTLLFCIAAFGLLMAAVSFSSARVLGSASLGWNEWGGAMLASGAGFMLLFLRGHAPVVLTYVVANLMLVTSAVFIAEAHARLFDLAVTRHLAVATISASTLALLGVYGFGIPGSISVLMVSGSLCLLLGHTVRMVVAQSGWHAMPGMWISLTATLALSVTFAIRSLGVVLNQSPASTRDEGSQPSVGLLMSGGLFIVAASIGFILMVHERQRRDVLERARRDGLTGLYNRTAFFELAGRIDASAPGHYAVAMIDIDHFKAINDSRGHAAGDVAIAHAAGLISRSIRSTDLAGRYGGEEFCVLLHDCGREEAQVFATRVVERAAHEAVRLPGGGTIGFTVSIGYAWPSPDGSSAHAGIEPMLARADAALYDAKRQGRNRAVGAEPRVDDRAPRQAPVMQAKAA